MRSIRVGRVGPKVQHGWQEFRLAILAEGDSPALRVSRTNTALCVGFLQRGIPLGVATLSECLDVSAPSVVTQTASQRLAFLLPPLSGCRAFLRRSLSYHRSRTRARVTHCPASRSPAWHWCPRTASSRSSLRSDDQIMWSKSLCRPRIKNQCSGNHLSLVFSRGHGSPRLRDSLAHAQGSLAYARGEPGAPYQAGHPVRPDRPDKRRASHHRRRRRSVPPMGRTVARRAP